MSFSLFTDTRMISIFSCVNINLIRFLNMIWYNIIYQEHSSYYSLRNLAAKLFHDFFHFHAFFTQTLCKRAWGDECYRMIISYTISYPVILQRYAWTYKIFFCKSMTVKQKRYIESEFLAYTVEEFVYLKIHYYYQCQALNM